MNVVKVILRLSIKELLKLGVIFLKHPLLIWPTLKATQLTVSICNRFYPQSHHGHGRANAFRHALWNMLVAKAALDAGCKMISSIQWAATITDLHEELSPNPLLEKTMDLHNNQIGRLFFEQIGNQSVAKLVRFLQDQLPKAVLIRTTKEVKEYNKVLVYLTD